MMLGTEEEQDINNEVGEEVEVEEDDDKRKRSSRRLGGSRRNLMVAGAAALNAGVVGGVVHNKRNRKEQAIKDAEESSLMRSVDDEVHRQSKSQNRYKKRLFRGSARNLLDPSAYDSSNSSEDYDDDSSHEDEFDDQSSISTRSEYFASRGNQLSYRSNSELDIDEFSSQSVEDRTSTREMRNPQYSIYLAT